MKFGKIRVENHQLLFVKRVKSCQVPCEDIRWAYNNSDKGHHNLTIFTRMKKWYSFEMTEKEAAACLRLLKEENPHIIAGAPQGAPIGVKSVFNTRDMGGMETEDGRHILPCQLLRSGDLYHLSREDQELLRDEYHLRTVLDFRTETEIAQRPDTVIDGVVYIENPIIEEDTLGISHGGDAMAEMMTLEGDPVQYMIRMYQNLVLDPWAQNHYARFFQYLLENEEGGSVLWHCTAGKDRAGVGTMLLLTALGVSRGAIMDDYMRTNTCMKKDLEYLIRMMESKDCSQALIEKAGVLLSARECYLQSAINTIISEYGSMERYMRRAMCLTARNLEKLKNRYLV